MPNEFQQFTSLGHIDGLEIHGKPQHSVPFHRSQMNQLLLLAQIPGKL